MIVAAIPSPPSLSVRLLIARAVQPEDEPRIPGAEGAQELGAVTDLPAAGQQVAAEPELPPLPGGQRGGDIAVRRRELLGQGPSVGGGLGGPGRGVRADRERCVTDQA